MQITETIKNRIEQIKESPILIGICGRAGSGKSTLAQRIKKELEEAGVKTTSYSGDWRFRLDSEGRKKFLQEKWLTGLDEYLRAVNQFNWWDFEKIYTDLNLLREGKSLQIQNAYNRETGKKDMEINLEGIRDGVIFYENCILGGVEVLDSLHMVILLNDKEELCLIRLMRKDSARRTLPELLVRHLITMYSENLFFRFLLEKFPQKLLVCNSEGIMGEFPQLVEVDHIPVPYTSHKETNSAKGTVFCDLDGTLIKHVSIPSETGEEIEILEGSSEKLKELKEKGYHLILTTSRPHHKIFGIINKLKAHGIEFDQIISDLPVGPRHLINDDKGEERRAFIHILERDKGIKNINID
jgi:uridine kinase